MVASRVVRAPRALLVLLVTVCLISVWSRLGVGDYGHQGCVAPGVDAENVRQTAAARDVR
jgi:hypothetical protein